MFPFAKDSASQSPSVCLFRLGVKNVGQQFRLRGVTVPIHSFSLVRRADTLVGWTESSVPGCNSQARCGAGSPAGVFVRAFPVLERPLPQRRIRTIGPLLIREEKTGGSNSRIVSDPSFALTLCSTPV